MKATLLAILLAFSIQVCFSQTSIVYSAPRSNFQERSNSYLVNIIQGDIRQKSFVYKITAGNGTGREWGQEQNHSFNFTVFSFSGKITIEVIKLNSSATTATVYPTRIGVGTLNAMAQGNNSVIRFTLSHPDKIRVDFNDDPGISNALGIFADTLESPADVPSLSSNQVFTINTAVDTSNIPASATVAYFRPGIHDIGRWNIPTNIKQVYIAGGAYVTGYLYSANGFIKINGRGILSNAGYPYHYPSKVSMGEDYNTWYKTININSGRGVIIEGLTLVDASSYNMVLGGTNMIVKNVNIVAFRLNNDGISLNGTGNTITGCFIRTNDDAITLSGNNITISNCVFDQLQASIIELGWTPHSMDQINITNCDVVHDKASKSDGDVGFINAMNYSQAKQEAVVKNVTVSNINFDTPVLRFLDIRGDRSFKLANYNATSGSPWTYSNFHFSNIHFNQGAKQSPLIILHGFNDSQPLSDFSFENIYINGKKTSQDDLNNQQLLDTKSVKQLVAH